MEILYFTIMTRASGIIFSNCEINQKGMNIQKGVMESQNIDNFHNVRREKYNNVYILSKIPNSFTGFINSSK